jgi:hypothetical protein
MIIFSLKLEPISNVEAFCPDFSREYKKAETVAAKREEWLKDGWRDNPLASHVAAILVPGDDPAVDKQIPATAEGLVKFVKAITSGKDAVVCDHFHACSAQLLVALSRVHKDTAGRTEAAAALYALRRRQLGVMFSHLDGKDYETAFNVHNPVRAMKLDDMSTAQLAQFLGLQPNATRLTVLKDLAQLLGITP